MTKRDLTGNRLTKNRLKENKQGSMIIKMLLTALTIMLVLSLGIMQKTLNKMVMSASIVYAAGEQERTSIDNEAKVDKEVAFEPVEIRTYNELAAATAHTDGYYVLMADIDMSKAGADGWKPWNFNGTFDGNGYTLYNMNISTTTDITAKTYDGNLKEYDTYFAGFFGITKGAVIRNLNITGAYVEPGQSSQTSTKSILAAILVGYMDNTVVSNCKVEGYVSLTSTAAMWGCAGVAGFGNGLIEAATADVTLVCIDGNPDEADRDEQFMGGIYADGYIDVKDCTVTIDGYISERGYVHSGGIAGLYILYPVSGSYVADIAGNTINGRITFFEDNTDRRAYCRALAGERMNVYTTSRENIDNFVRNEVYDYSQTLKPENYERKIYDVDNPYESDNSTGNIAAANNNQISSGELIQGAADNVVTASSLGSGSRVLFGGLSDTARIIISVAVIAAAVGAYYFITRRIRKRK